MFFDVAIKIVAHPFGLHLSQLAVIDQLDIVLAQLQLNIQIDFVELLAHHQYLMLNFSQQLLGVLVLIRLILFQQDAPFYIGDAHPEKLIHVIGIDTQKAQPLDGRIADIGSFLQHAAVKRQPAEFPWKHRIVVGRRVCERQFHIVYS